MVSLIEAPTSRLTGDYGYKRMKLITAIIKPFKVDEVRQAVADIGIQGMTVTEVHGYARAAAPRSPVLGEDNAYIAGGASRAKVEFAVDDSMAEQVIEAVSNVARTGTAGDGTMWVVELEQALRIRTGETGPDAVYRGVP